MKARQRKLVQLKIPGTGLTDVERSELQAKATRLDIDIVDIKRERELANAKFRKRIAEKLKEKAPIIAALIEDAKS